MAMGVGGQNTLLKPDLLLRGLSVARFLWNDERR